MEGKLQTITESFKKVPITKNTFEKIKGYAKICGVDECYGFLLTPKDKNDGIVYNAILAANQRVSGASAGITGEAAAHAKAEIKNLGYKAVGFWHSHGHGNPFHSGTDNHNMEHLMLAFATNVEEKYRTEAKEGYDIEGSDIVFRRKGQELRLSFGNGDFCFDVKPIGKDYFQPIKEDNSEPLLIVTKKLNLIINDENKRLMTKNPCNIQFGKNEGKSIQNIGVAYSIVVNSSGKHYAEIGVSKWCNVCEKLETKISEAELNIIEAENDIQFNRQTLEEDLEKRIIGYKKFRWF